MASDIGTFMPLYIGSYQKNTSRLSTEQHGAYLLLLMDYWISGPPPDDDAVLARITKLSPEAWAATRPILAGYFRIAQGRWRQSRADIERERAQAMVDKAKRAGRASAQKRAAKREQKPESRPDDFAHIPKASEQALAPGWPGVGIPSPTPTQIPDPRGSAGPVQLTLVHDADKAPPPSPEPSTLNLKAVIFGAALQWLQRQLPRASALSLRSWLGRLVRDHGEAWTLEALRRAQRDAALEPKAYVEGCLRAWKARGGPPAPGAEEIRADPMAIAGAPTAKS